jgi:hypothetical protein
MLRNDPDYQNHAVFIELDQYIEFYKQLSHSVFLWVASGTRSIFNTDTYVFSSIQGTLTSIHSVLRDGRINDAYALLRKYHDSVTINIYSNLYLEDHASIDNFVVKQIDDWVTGKAQLPEYRIMSQYIRSASRVAPITVILDADNRYKLLRKRCNDHTHYNFYRNVLFNDNEISLPDRNRELDVLLGDVRDLLILHVAYLFFANGHYMMSSDYVDSLECGLTPEPDSEYWVAPFVQDVFDRTVTIHRPDVAAAIRKHTRMHLA